MWDFIKYKRKKKREENMKELNPEESEEMIFYQPRNPHETINGLDLPPFTHNDIVFSVCKDNENPKELLTINELGEITFHKSNFPGWKADNFAREFVNIVEKLSKRVTPRENPQTSLNERAPQ